jgi:predicted transposase YbfD/YdcC
MAVETSISVHFRELPDPRIERSKAQALVDILTIALCAVLCGAESWVDLETFGREKERWLRTFLALPNGIPSHDTFARVFARLDPAAFERCFLGWVRAVGPAAGGQVAVDGKTLRGSRDRANGKAALHLVSAWASASGLTLGQVAVDQKSNEITAIPALLDLLDLAGCVVSADAMGAQTGIAAQIVGKGGDYVLALKANQGRLHADVEALFRRAEAAGFRDLRHTTAVEVEKGHGRIDKRTVRALGDREYLDWLDGRARWAGLRSVVMVEATRRTGEERETERRYYISSLPPDAPRLAAAIRRHWGSENCLHWVLDVTFGEDASRMRAGHSARNFALVRKIALNLLRADPAKGSLATKRFKAALNPDYLTSLLSTRPRPS